MVRNDGGEIAQEIRADDEETVRAFPTLDLIEHDDIRAAAIETIQEIVPDYFFVANAATTFKHHNPEACHGRGLWVHTLMVATAYEELQDSHASYGADDVPARALDAGRAAALLHDIRKKGEEYHDGKAAEDDHDIRAAKKIQEVGAFPDDVGEFVAGAAETHMGPWGEGRAPETTVEMLVHRADMVASTTNIDVGIYKPPEEIIDTNPGVNNATF